MSRVRKWMLTAAVAAALTGGVVQPVFADTGGVPNERSCGGIGRQAQDFAAQPGPMHPGALFAAQGPFTCDDVGEAQGKGF